jgi:hypothetical protein
LENDKTTNSFQLDFPEIKPDVNVPVKVTHLEIFPEKHGRKNGKMQ